MLAKREGLRFLNRHTIPTITRRPMMSDKLKPCPWQHVRPHPLGAVTVSDVLAGCYRAECQDCDATGPIADTEPDAIAAWNRRYNDE